MNEAREPFGELLRQFRSAGALSQDELAERTGLSRRGISDLERGLSLAPRFETVRLLADGLALAESQRAALLAAARPAPQVESPDNGGQLSLGSLPVPLTRLVGREAELAALRAALLDDDVRWLSLTGPGGVGKTRLAIAVAAGLQQAFPDGTVFVDLSSLSDPDLVASTIAAALGVRGVARQTVLEALMAFVADKRLLLVLDNCERLLAAAPDLVALLEICPHLTIFSTSREPFRVRGEQQVPLAPLPLPQGDRPPLGELTQSPAVALFVERATAIQPDFALSDANAVAVAAICQRLDGLPLAIELAAARVKTLPPEALWGRLERRLPLLTGGGRDLPARQRTMRDAIAWSYDLLSSQEQAFFRYLSVFAGGFTLRAAENVAPSLWQVAREAASDTLATLDLVGSLVEKSLLEAVPDPAAGDGEEKRFRMLEIVREFGLEQLALAG
jgi:predicted ATPase/DNA-binding XRE family transcriptional regulator